MYKIGFYFTNQNISISNWLSLHKPLIDILFNSYCVVLPDKACYKNEMSDQSDTIYVDESLEYHEVLDKIKGNVNYVWLYDMNDTIIGKPDILLEHDCYSFKHGTSHIYYSNLIFKTTIQWDKDKLNSTDGYKIPGNYYIESDRYVTELGNDYFSIGEKQYNESNYKNSIENYLQYIDECKDISDEKTYYIYYKIGLCYLKLNQIDTSISNFNKSSTFCINRIESKYQCIRILRKNNKYKELQSYITDLKIPEEPIHENYINQLIYDYYIFIELGLCYYSKLFPLHNYKLSKHFFSKALQSPLLPDTDVPKLINNINEINQKIITNHRSLIDISLDPNTLPITIYFDIKSIHVFRETLDSFIEQVVDYSYISKWVGIVHNKDDLMILRNEYHLFQFIQIDYCLLHKQCSTPFMIYIPSHILFTRKYSYIQLQHTIIEDNTSIEFIFLHHSSIKYNKAIVTNTIYGNVLQHITTHVQSAPYFRRVNYNKGQIIHRFTTPTTLTYSNISILPSSFTYINCNHNVTITTSLRDYYTLQYNSNIGSDEIIHNIKLVDKNSDIQWKQNNIYIDNQSYYIDSIKCNLPYFSTESIQKSRRFGILEQFSKYNDTMFKYLTEHGCCFNMTSLDNCKIYQYIFLLESKSLYCNIDTILSIIGVDCILIYKGSKKIFDYIDSRSFIYFPYSATDETILNFIQHFNSNQYSIYLSQLNHSKEQLKLKYSVYSITNQFIQTLDYVLSNIYCIKAIGIIENNSNKTKLLQSVQYRNKIFIASGDSYKTNMLELLDKANDLDHILIIHNKDNIFNIDNLSICIKTIKQLEHMYYDILFFNYYKNIGTQIDNEANIYKFNFCRKSNIFLVKKNSYLDYIDYLQSDKYIETNFRNICYFPKIN